MITRASTTAIANRIAPNSGHVIDGSDIDGCELKDEEDCEVWDEVLCGLDCVMMDWLVDDRSGSGPTKWNAESRKKISVSLLQLELVPRDKT